MKIKRYCGNFHDFMQIDFMVKTSFYQEIVIFTQRTFVFSLSPSRHCFGLTYKKFWVTLANQHTPWSNWQFFCQCSIYCYSRLVCLSEKIVFFFTVSKCLPSNAEKIISRVAIRQLTKKGWVASSCIRSKILNETGIKFKMSQ